jgi:nucleoside-diphosphate-sugar epimerase
MNVLVIGGSGIVGTLIVPLLAQRHTLRIFDRIAPQDGAYAYFAGDVTQYDDLLKALAGMDALIYMAMGNLDWKEVSGIVTAFDVNIKGLHLALRAANEVGITQAVYASTMSISGGDLLTRYFPDEEMTPDSSGLYGFTKYMGELVCLNATRLWGMNVNALRMCHPTAEDKWFAETVIGTPTIATTASDISRAFLAALEYCGGFSTFMISGDYENKIMNMSKAKRLLDW